MDNGVVLGKSTRIEDVQLGLKIDGGPDTDTFRVCECSTRSSRLSEEGIVVIGTAASQKTSAATIRPV